MATTVPQINVGDDYKEKYGFFDPEKFVFKAKRGLNEEIVREISFMKGEPEWMTKMRLRSLDIFRKKPMPEWGAMVSAGQSNLLTNWWLSTFPGLAIFLTALILNMLGDTVQDILASGAARRI